MMPIEGEDAGLARRLWAVHEIRQLAYRYAHAIDFRDREELLSLWDETAEPATLPDIDIHVVRANVDLWLAKPASILFVGNHLVHLEDDDNATGRVYCLPLVDLGERFVEQAVLYLDRYVRRGGRWLFVRRRHMLWYGQERHPHPMLQEPAAWPRRQVGRGTLPGELLGG